MEIPEDIDNKIKKVCNLLSKTNQDLLDIDKWVRENGLESIGILRGEDMNMYMLMFHALEGDYQGIIDVIQRRSNGL